MDSNFPEWTKSNVGITTPLTLPEAKVSNNEAAGEIRFGYERETECLVPFCFLRFVVPKCEPDFSRHLLQDHQIVIGKVDVNYHVTLPPPPVAGFRIMFILYITP